MSRSIRRYTKIIALAAILLVAKVESSHAQYYSWGADRANLKWSTIETDSVKLIFPDSVEATARRTMHYIDAVSPDIGFSYNYSAMKIPFVLHAENFQSNGLVMWAPKRVEFLTSPAIDGFSMPWVKQLVAHEYRHAVQYNNINKSTMKWLTYLLGQQGATIGLLFPSLYALEGDAVLTETQMSTYGRGKQPSFSIGYRAIGEELLTRKHHDKWFCGSYKSYVPDHYELGYQIVSHAYDKYGENIWNRVFDYASKYPFTIAPQNIVLKKYYDTSSSELFEETFEELLELWDQANSADDSSMMVAPLDTTNYTTYSFPIALDNSRVVALKSDYNNPSRFVEFNTQDQSEKFIAHTGYISTRPKHGGGRLWWSEYRRSPLFSEKVDSKICYMDLDNQKTNTLKGISNALYPTPIDNSTEHIAYVEYHYSGQFSVVELEGKQEIKRTAIDYPKEVHSLAWDNKTRSLYVIITDDDGMWLGEVGDNGVEKLTTPAYITLSDLSAKDGVLYFGSIYSGKDEVHCFDLESRKEYQLTSSKFGSFDGSAPSQDGVQYLTTYNKYGYNLAKQRIDTTKKEVTPRHIPHNVVNLDRVKWDIINLDTVRFERCDSIESEHIHKHKHYSKMGHMFNIHSWAPAKFSPYTLISEQGINISAGATILTQNLLSSCEGYLSYGWDREQGSIVTGALSYNGLGVRFDLSATYGGTQNSYFLSLPTDDCYKGFDISATLPLIFQQGYHTKSLSITTGWGYSNGITPHIKGIDYNPSTLVISSINYDPMVGVNKLIFGISFTDYVRSAYRSLTSPWIYSLSASYSTDPINRDFSDLMTLYASVTTPGLLPHNSLSVAAAYQNTYGGIEMNGVSLLGYKSSTLIPRGYYYSDINNRNFIASSINYKFPLWYPEGGISGLIYFKRISMNLGGDYAQFDTMLNEKSRIYSLGGDLSFDINVFNMPSASTSTIKISLYKPADRNLYLQFGLSVPF